MRNSLKKPVDRQTFVTKHVILNHLKLERALVAPSCFRWTIKWQISILCTPTSFCTHSMVKFFSWAKFWSCCQFFFIGKKKATIGANPIHLVTAFYAISPLHCLNWICINCYCLITYKDQRWRTYLHTICTTAYMKFGKKNGWPTDICPKMVNFGPPKTGMRLVRICFRKFHHYY